MRTFASPPPLSRRRLLRAAALSAVPLPAAAARAQTAAPPPSARERLKAEADALKPLMKTPLARAFLAAVADLPAPAPRTLYRDPTTKALLSKASAAKLDAEARGKLTPVPVSEAVYYNTRYGSPLAYARALEVLGERGGVEGVSGKRVLDFGYGSIGHLRVLAALGADAVGVDVDPFLRELYSAPGDTGPAKGNGGKTGRVTLADGQWPTSPEVARTVGGGYDLILSKNTLKMGYLHPSQTVDKRLLVDLGVSDEAFVKALHGALKPGGLVLIYNLSPAPSKPGQPFKPHAEGKSPFPPSLWESAGFAVVASDAEDTPAARDMARALAWDKPPVSMDLTNDLFAHYTLVRKKG